MSVALAIDLVTYVYKGIIGQNNTKKIDTSNYKVSALIPIYNEEKNLESTINDLLNQSHPLENIFLLDDCSNDRTPEIIEEYVSKYKEIHTYRSPKPRTGKANNINHIINTATDELGDFIYVIDSDIRIDKNHVEKLLSGFSDEKIMAVTGRSRPFVSEGRIAAMLSYSRRWCYKVFAFRKKAQALRNGLYVLSGANSIYRKEYLKNNNYLDTLCEDIEQTWRLQELGYKVAVIPNAVCRTRVPGTIKGYWKQIHRWYRATFQTYYTHGKKLFDAKNLFYTTLLPAHTGATLHSMFLLAMPVLAIFEPQMTAAMMLADFGSTIVYTSFLSPDSLLHLPSVYLHKYLNATAWLSALVTTTYEYMTKKTDKWRGNWERVENANASLKDKEHSINYTILNYIPKHNLKQNHKEILVGK